MSSVSSAQLKKVSSNPVETNVSQGSYHPFFFDMPEYGLSRVELNSRFFNSEDVEKLMLQGNFSFAYLREDKLRTVDVYNKDGEKLQFQRFQEFLDFFGIHIRSKNLFKTGKYLSRVFRPIKYGSFFKGLDVFINDNPRYSGKVTDGISLISVELAKSLGWENVEESMSAQFTLFFSKGLVKGHCVVSSKIKHDIIIYGDENIKEEITLNNGYEYLTLEPVKLDESLRFDIQSMLNLWNLFGAEQFLSWSYTGMQSFKEDLFAGRLINWLDNFDDIDKDEYDNEQWTLRKAIWSKVDYTKYPGLIRLAWTMMRNSILRYADNNHGQPAFRIPVPNGKRAYIRVDLRNHDKDGNFNSSVAEGCVELDRYGNLWIHENDIEEFMNVKGGADQDDSVAIIPIEDGKAVIYRNPNQYGEYGIHKIVGKDIELEHGARIIGDVQVKEITGKESSARDVFSSSGNTLLDSFLRAQESVAEYFIEYNIQNLIRTYSKICENTASIGVAANAEMIRSAIGITKPKLSTKLLKQFNWNLERIIDATVKDGIDAKDDMAAVQGLFQYVVENNVRVPKSLLSRFPEKMQNNISIESKHPMDLLLDAIKILIDRIDVEILGRGSASKGNRIPGMIDRIDTPIIELGLLAINNPLYDAAIGLLKGYNRDIAIMLETTKNVDNAELIRKEKIEAIQTKLLKKLSVYSLGDRQLIVNVFAYEIYKSSSSVHDSILWIGDKGNNRGTTSDMIEMLANVGLAYHIKKNGSVTRYAELTEVISELKQIRVWSKEELRADIFSSASEIMVDDKSVLINDKILNLGDECKITSGSYKIKNVVQSVSRKNNSRFLKNSITVYLF
ncbi:MAG: hypothetical protein M1480_13665 [Bacteroidetes bacterium]|nr:hypothetical protein [Bacteroidota bacterium]